MRVKLQPTYILHTRPYRDNSQLLEVFTAEYGRLSLVGRGRHRRARGGSTAALLQLFTPLLVSFGGKSELKTLSAVEAAAPAHQLGGDTVFSGMYLNELLVRLLHRHDPHPQLFASYTHSLEKLAGGRDVEEVLRTFEYTLLDELGYSFSLGVQGDTGDPVEEDGWYHYRGDCGLVQSRGVAEPGQPLFSGADLLQMAGGQFGTPVRHTAKRLLRLALSEHLGPGALKSRDLFRQLRGGVGQPRPERAQDKGNKGGG